MAARSNLAIRPRADITLDSIGELAAWPRESLLEAAGAKPRRKPKKKLSSRR